MKTAIEPFIYRHGQSIGYQVRRKYRWRGKVREISRYFAKSTYGSLRAAADQARRWKRRHLPT